ncbi:MAG: 23S rRNA (guanosine(2251)-2'-O)-methyltransferase RlmB [Lachnospiraceae bacterium]|nr:23S rRNA (guanosine(2251)-2'-O)-methyltransferase RlmB [Lachnospiraceae bacterium]
MSDKSRDTKSNNKNRKKVGSSYKAKKELKKAGNLKDKIIVRSNKYNQNGDDQNRDDFKTDKSTRDYNQRENSKDSPYKENYIEGRNACLEAFRSGKTIDKLYVLEGAGEGSVQTIIKEAKKADTIINFVKKERLDLISQTGKHQGVIAVAAAYTYAEIEDIFENANKKNEDPFIILLDHIEDPHNLGSIIRTANLAGAHGVIIPKRHAVGLTPVVSKASAGAINYTPVVKVTNLSRTIEELKERGVWFVCADMLGETMYDLNLTGPIGLVMGAEGSGVSRLVREKCDMTAKIPMKGDIESLNVSVACGVMAFEIVKQRMSK